MYEYLNNIIHVLSLSYDSPFRPNGQKTMVLPTSRTKSTFAISSLAGSWRHTCTRDRWMMADLLFMEQPPKKDGKVIGDSLLSIDDINLVYYHLWYQFSVLSSMYHHLWNIFIDYIYQYIIDSSIFFHQFLLFYIVLKGKRFEIGTCGGKTTQSMDRWFQVWRPRTGGVYSWDTQLSKGFFTSCHVQHQVCWL